MASGNERTIADDRKTHSLPIRDRRVAAGLAGPESPPLGSSLRPRVRRGCRLTDDIHTHGVILGVSLSIRIGRRPWHTRVREVSSPMDRDLEKTRLVRLIVLSQGRKWVWGPTGKE